MTKTIDIEALCRVARAVGRDTWVLPLSSPLDVVVPASNRDRLPVTVVSAKEHAEAKFVCAFDPEAVIDLASGVVAPLALEDLSDIARAARPGIRTYDRVAEDFYEVSIDGNIIATTDSAPVARFLTAVTVEAALELLDHAAARY